MKVSNKTLIAASLASFAAGLFVAPRLDTLIKAIDPKLASPLSANIRWLVPSFIAFAGVAYLLKPTQQSSEVDKPVPVAKADNKEPVVKKEFEPAIRNVPDTSREPATDEKKRVDAMIAAAAAEKLENGEDKTYLFYVELIQWLEAIGTDHPDQSRTALENGNPPSFSWNHTLLFSVGHYRGTAADGTWPAKFSIFNPPRTIGNTEGFRVWIIAGEISVDCNTICSLMKHILNEAWKEHSPTVFPLNPSGRNIKDQQWGVRVKSYSKNQENSNN